MLLSIFKLNAFANPVLRPQNSFYQTCWENVILAKRYSVPKCPQSGRFLFTGQSKSKFRNMTVRNYAIGVGLLVAGLSYAVVPMYKLFCQSTGRGGQAVLAEAAEKISKMKKASHRLITVYFRATVSSQMKWRFEPQQQEMKVSPGETALAFFTATNPTDDHIIGISTYNIVPYEAGAYFNKIQCFCFEEQMLNPHETVDMPVFFYIDPEYAEDPVLEKVNSILLSYTFFKSKDGLQIPVAKTK